MVTFQQVWQILNTDIGELLGTPGETVEAGAEVSKASLELMIALGLLGTPLAPAAAVAAGLSFVGLSRKGLNLLRAKTNNKPTPEQWVGIAFPLAYIMSFDSLVHKNDWLKVKIGVGVSGNDIDNDAKQQIDQLGELNLDQALVDQAWDYFPESKLGQALNQQLSQYLKQVGLDPNIIPLVTGWVAWGTYGCIDSLLSYEPEDIVNSFSLHRAAAQQTAPTRKYGNIETYLTEQISPNPSDPNRLQLWKVLGEDFKIPDIYVPLKAQLLDTNGKVKKQANPVNLESWAKQQLTNPEKNGQVMFIQGGPGRGKTVFCRMLADWVRQHLHPIWTPILIRLRDIHTFEKNIENTLRAAVQADFAKKDGWLTDPNTRFLFLLDGFDELRMEGRTIGGIEDFLKKVGYYQENCQQNPNLGHRFLVTGRELALQGIVTPRNLERVQIALMDETLQQQWFRNWGNLVGQDKATGFKRFFQAQHCPERVKELAQEPLLLYLLAAMHRDGKLTDQMFVGASSTNAKILIYQTALDWVLTKQRPKDLHFEITEQETEDLRRILTEAGLCVTQAGGEWASITMIEERLKEDDGARELLEKAQKRIGENPLRNALAAFYLRPASGSGVTEGAVEFVHKSFGEFLCALRLQESLEDWTEPRKKRRGFTIDNDQLAEEIYDLLGYGRLTPEIVDYLMALLDTSDDFRPVQLFERLEDFYGRWCNGEFIDILEETTLPQKTGQKLRKHGVELGQRQVDIAAGLNTMILLLELHRYAQTKDELKDKISFHPCGKPDTEGFDSKRLLRIINYSNSVEVDNFLKTIGGLLSLADLRWVNLIDANLSSANLIKANLIKADLSSANLSSANLSSANLIKADLSFANLIETDLIEANLIEADLIESNLIDADLSSANLIEANLSSANLIEANLIKANLIKANLIKANLIKANLIKADLRQADFRQANLTGANLTGANLTGANLENISWNEDTKWENVQGLETAINVPEALKNDPTSP
ncbi:pentapeptide repeat-containing protein [Moorena sp. SIO1F2]|uniref:pentapeptide repeat-containing protein n=1 Tax=Moorena sp. SIO1F2 TaxID=2607819 RepID=UPI002600265C|nr:pentapeptide repeat-containing protein [Moorena sp. SIO1F2]